MQKYRPALLLMNTLDLRPITCVKGSSEAHVIVDTEDFSESGSRRKAWIRCGNLSVSPVEGRPWVATAWFNSDLCLGEPRLALRFELVGVRLNYISAGGVCISGWIGGGPETLHVPDRSYDPKKDKKLIKEFLESDRNSEEACAARHSLWAQLVGRSVEINFGGVYGRK